MKLRNKAGTWWRSKELTLGPGEVADVNGALAHELVRQYPWHFELAQDGAPPRLRPSRPSVDQPAASPDDRAEGAASGRRRR